MLNFFQCSAYFFAFLVRVNLHLHTGYLFWASDSQVVGYELGLTHSIEVGLTNDEQELIIRTVDINTSDFVGRAI